MLGPMPSDMFCAREGLSTDVAAMSSLAHRHCQYRRCHGVLLLSDFFMPVQVATLPHLMTGVRVQCCRPEAPAMWRRLLRLSEVRETVAITFLARDETMLNGHPGWCAKPRLRVELIPLVFGKASDVLYEEPAINQHTRRRRKSNHVTSPTQHRYD